jgi:hypothetical protein
VIDAGAFIVYRPLQWWLICESSRPLLPGAVSACDIRVDHPEAPAYE